MTLSVIQVDAFCDGPFTGNPAAVIQLESWLDDSLLQKIAEELNLSETAFLVKSEGKYLLRWFTPTCEVDLCGHATLASAHVLYNHYAFAEDQIVFSTKSGDLMVKSLGHNQYSLNFPADKPRLIARSDYPKLGLDKDCIELHKGKDDYLAIFESQQDIENIKPDFTTISQLDSRGLIISAPGVSVDFVSRGFFPQAGVNEDPATGSAHTLLTPYWSSKKNQTDFKATQLSNRKGHFFCSLKGNRVLLIGHGVTILKGEIYL